jgi:hypothetical protein
VHCLDVGDAVEGHSKYSREVEVDNWKLINPTVQSPQDGNNIKNGSKHSTIAV